MIAAIAGNDPAGFSDSVAFRQFLGERGQYCRVASVSFLPVEYRLHFASLVSTYEEWGCVDYLETLWLLVLFTDNGFKLKTYFFRQPWNGFVLVAPKEVLPNVVGRQTRERTISLVEIRQDFTHGDERLLIEYSRIDFLLPWRDVPKLLVLVACGIEQYSRGFRSNSVELGQLLSRPIRTPAKPKTLRSFET